MCRHSCYLILATIKVNIGSVSNNWDFPASEKAFHCAFLYHWHHLTAERRLYCSTYEIQSMKGWEQGVTLHKALWVCEKPQNMLLLWETVSESFLCSSCLCIYTKNVKLWQSGHVSNQCTTLVTSLCRCLFDNTQLWPSNSTCFFFLNDFLSKRPFIWHCSCLRITITSAMPPSRRSYSHCSLSTIQPVLRAAAQQTWDNH